MTDLTPSPQPRSLDEKLADFHDRLLLLPAEMSATRDMVVEIAAYASESGKLSIPHTAVAATTAIRKLEERIVAIEQRLGL